MKYFFVSDCDIVAVKFLDRYLPLNKEKIKRLIVGGEVRINGEKATKESLIKKGDTVTVFVPMSFGMKEPEIVYCDENILVVDKPVGYEVETSLKYFLERTYGVLYCVHRLDRNTTGLTIFARTAEAENDLSAAIKKRSIAKFYLVWLKGVLKEDERVLKAYLTKNDNGVTVSDIPKQGSKEIITKYKVMKRENGNTLAEVELITGRTHQIRAHFAHIGHEVIGDSRYGDGNGYQLLRAYKLIFNGLEKLQYLNGKIIQV